MVRRNRIRRQQERQFGGEFVVEFFALVEYNEKQKMTSIYPTETAEVYVGDAHKRNMCLADGRST